MPALIPCAPNSKIRIVRTRGRRNCVKAQIHEVYVGWNAMRRGRDSYSSLHCYNLTLRRPIQIIHQPARPPLASLAPTAGAPTISAASKLTLNSFPVNRTMFSASSARFGMNTRAARLAGSAPVCRASATDSFSSCCTCSHAPKRLNRAALAEVDSDIREIEEDIVRMLSEVTAPASCAVIPALRIFKKIGIVS